MFELVHTCTAWYDGPRRGVANLDGTPHLFESEWNDGVDEYADTFLLTPVDPETLALALEGWTIWRRWEAAYYRGETTLDTHPALPADRPRYGGLEQLLKSRLLTDPTRAVRKQATFQVRDDPAWSGVGLSPLAVEWRSQSPG